MMKQYDPKNGTKALRKYREYAVEMDRIERLAYQRSLLKQEGIENISSESRTRHGVGADIGNGYTVGFVELKKLNQLSRAGVDTQPVFAKSKQPGLREWSL